MLNSFQNMFKRNNEMTPAAIQALRARYDTAGQGHLFTFFESLSNDEKKNLVSQLNALDVERVNRVYAKAIEGAEAATSAEGQAAAVEPLPDDVFDSVMTSSKEKVREWETLGLSLIAQGKIAVILMAGGQGTRLGSSAPKGCYDINLPSQKSLFQLQAERILRLQEVAKQYRRPLDAGKSVIPWYIMTSGPTNDATISFFKQHNYFGMKPENVIFFEQGTLPCLTNEGKILLESKSQIAIAPDGNGGIYAALQNRGVIASLKERGILYSHCYCVDNCLARVADPVFIGYCASKDTDCGVKVVRKASPTEPVGVVCLRNSKYSVVEYSEISAEVAERTKPNGELAFGAANIANHYFSTAFLERVQSFEDQLEYHIARKKIKHTDLTSGEQVAPKSNNGMKLELFVFDVFPFVERLAVLEVDRKDDFSPLKNAPGTGVDCPETSRRDIVAQHVRFIEAAGGRVDGENADDKEKLEFELSSWVSYAGEGLEEIVRDKTITAPAIIESREDLLKALH
ncbi:nucleotide-diphospho-sugar transferase [Jimgerdemannia flammicorona]|uniref:UDP-N-acetylglucosamine diphosphorylase n=1 Tax=Jimgerdemannia flammicorona TaxID=994334 RepID=A0A433PV02_9FUNG|nr:nucleotide-diphospho-sugar transferase [Jimgerdemannia flammicorona]